MLSATAVADLVIDLPRSSHAAGIGRRALRRVLAEADAFELLRDAELAVSELITNAVMHTHGAILLEAWFDRVSGVLRVEVSDDDPRVPVEGSQPDSRGGRGLKVVGAVTTCWG